MSATPELIIERSYVPTMGTFGFLTVFIDGEATFRCLTVERPWNDNKRRISCIPRGRYMIKRSWFNKDDYEVFELEGVVGRSEILIHIANTPTEVEGCIGVGNKFGYVKGQWAVLNSRRTFKQLMKVLEGYDRANLTIINYVGGHT